MNVKLYIAFIVMGFNFVDLQASQRDAAIDKKLETKVASFVMMKIAVSDFDRKLLNDSRRIYFNSLVARKALEEELLSHQDLLSKRSSDRQKNIQNIFNAIESIKKDVRLVDFQNMKIYGIPVEGECLSSCSMIEKLLDPTPFWRPRQLDNSHLHHRCDRCMPFDYYCWPTTPNSRVLSDSILLARRFIDSRLKYIKAVGKSQKEEATEKEIVTSSGKLEIFIPSGKKAA